MKGGVADKVRDRLHRAYDAVLSEPVPADMAALLDKLA